MIKVTRLDGSEMFINAEHIETIEETPDTHITLSNGNRYLALESAAVLIERIVGYKAGLLHRGVSVSGKKYLRKKHAGTIRRPSKPQVCGD